MMKSAENWLADVQQGRGNMFDLFLFVGLLMALTYLWTRIVARLVD